MSVYLEFHPAAELLPLLTGDEYEELKESIRRNGQREPIIVTEKGQILDGRNRYRACKELDIDPELEVWDGVGAAEELVLDLNIHRRHLTTEQKHEVVARLLRLHPEKSDRSIAKLAHVSDKTTGSVRKELESSAEIPQLDHRVGADGKVRATPDDPSGDVSDSSPAHPFFTVEGWQALSSEERRKAIEEGLAEKSAKFNDQKDSDSIGWAPYTWNPVTGCLHNCDYCYARDIAVRRYTKLGEPDERFKPVFYPHRLGAAANTRHPDEFPAGSFERLKRELLAPATFEDDIGYANVFVCSMADLFGKWVPEEWIDAVLDRVRSNRQWTFLFLTKFPQRMAEFSYPPNCWLGTTVDRQWAVERAEKGFRKIKESGFTGVCWLSCEPMFEDLTFSSLEMFDWVVMGGASRSTKTPEFRPPFDWIVHLHNQARAAKRKVYHKANLFSRMEEYPLYRVKLERFDALRKYKDDSSA